MASEDDILLKLRKIENIEQIKQLKYRYIRLVDNRSFDEWADESLTENCYLSTTDLGTHIGRSNIAEAVRKSYGSCETIHHVHMPEIRMTGPDTATGIWSINDYSTWTLGGARVVEWGRGHYEDEYVLTERGWRIDRTVLERKALSPPGQSPANGS